MAPRAAPPWTCPSCGAPFAHRNATHSCVEVALDRHLVRRERLAPAAS